MVVVYFTYRLRSLSDRILEPGVPGFTFSEGGVWYFQK